MAAQIQPIKVWGQGGPNPPKVAIVLEELGLPYEFQPIKMNEIKGPEYLAINPNGRLPSIHDPNTKITLWESGAIVEYLVETYDKDHKISFEAGTPEYFHAKQWLFFQTSGQGPYFGQAAWFVKFHGEQIPSAIERYSKEVVRVSGVLDGYLAQQKEKYGDNGPWLVGNKCSYADLVFIPWQSIIKMIVSKEQYNEDDFPNLKDWMSRMNEKETVKKGFGGGKPAE